MQRSWAIDTLKADILTFEAEQFFIDIVTIKRKVDGKYDLRIEFNDNYISLDDSDARTSGFFPLFIDTFYTKLGNREKKVFHIDLTINILSSKNQPMAAVKALLDTLHELKSFGKIKNTLYRFIDSTNPAALPADYPNKLFASAAKDQQQGKKSPSAYQKNTR